MKKIIGIFLLLFVSQNLFAQSGWQWQNPLPQGNDLYSVKFANSNIGFVIGENSTVIKTTNGGVSWSLKKISTENLRLQCLSVVDSLTAFAVTLENKAFKTYDGGEIWISLPDLPNIGFLSWGDPFCFVNVTTGFVLDRNGNVYKTTTGGLNWFLNYTLGVLYISNEVHFISEQTGFITGGNDSTKIWKTTNQGTNWEVCFKINQRISIKDLHFINSNTGYAFYEYSDFGGPNNLFLLKSTNGGGNWNLVSNSPTENFYHKIHFSSNGNGVLMGVNIVSEVPNLKLFKTTNDGTNWTDMGTYGRAMAINFPLADIGYAVGFGGYIYKSTNFGNNWTCINSIAGDVYSLNTVTFPNNSTGFITGTDGTILKTSNSGETWNSSQIGHRNLVSSYFLNSNTGYIGADSNKMYKTTNGGSTWDTLSPNFPNPITSIFFVNERVGFFTNGSSNAVYKTTNAGISWTPVPFTINYGGMNYLQFIDTLTGFLCQNLYNPTSFPPYRAVYAYKTTNQGETWSLISFLENVNASGLKFVNENTGYMNAYKILKTTNGGINWANVLNVNDQGGIDILDLNSIYTGRYKSTNAGLNWTLYNTKAQSISGVRYLNQNTGIIICGNGGGILRTTDGGEIISSIYSEHNSNITPYKHFLSQNYPNPFNPSTKINYEVKSSGFVSLKVFDLLGEEVASLVNEKQNAGSYAVDFNSSEFNLPSGIYFYTLNAGEFKETRKMVLVK